MDRLFVAILGVLLIACSEPHQIVDEDQPENYILTKITLSGDIVVLPEVPILGAEQANLLSRTVSNDLYAIQIYSADRPTSIYSKYAYGLFDDLSLAEVELSDRMYYRFVVTALKEGKTKVKQTLGKYNDPFTVDLKPALVDNQFNYSTSSAFSGLTLGRAMMANDSKLYDRPEADRYVGEIIDFQPTKGVAVNVELKRVVFGIRLYSVDLTQGYVELSVDGAPLISISPENNSVDMIFTLKGLALNNKWIEDNYTETILCKAKWYCPGQPVQILGPASGQNITVRRGYRTPIKVETTYPRYPISVVLESEQLIDADEVIF